MHSKEYTQLLNSKRWKETRMAYLQQHPYCEQCLQAKPTPIYRAAIDVHHIIPVESARTMEDMERLCFASNTNLMALCVPCHIAIHQASRSHTKQGHKQRVADEFERWKQAHPAPTESRLPNPGVCSSSTPPHPTKSTCPRED